MKTDFEKGNELRQMIKTYIPFNISHKTLSKDKFFDEDNLRHKWVKFYISDDYVSIVINDGDKYIQSEICITNSGIDIKTLKKGNFKDIEFPNFDYLSEFIEDILKVNLDEIKSSCGGTEEQLRKQLKEIERQLNYINNK